jgi:hypothetical protein
MVLAFNYAVFAVPLARRGVSIDHRSKAMIQSQVKRNVFFTDSEESYMLDLFRKEKIAIDRKLLMLNVLAASLGILIASWTLFGMLSRREK